MGSVTDEIKGLIDIVDLVSETVQLKRSGRSYSGFCPFHDNTRSPSFYVFPHTQTWHCFGACSEGGDAFSFLMKKEGWEFKETLKYLADRTGVQLEPPKPVDPVKVAYEEKVGDLLTAVADYYHMLFLHAPQAEEARLYVQKRGLNAETIATFKLGYSLNSWDACRNHFNEQGYTDEELLAVGLLSENPERGTKYDRFRGRLMFPIRNLQGAVAGFGARTMEPDGLPKYLNSPQTDLFDKSHIVYNLDLAKRPIREAREVVIVEGYMDVIQAWQAGFRNLVAQMGTALTGHQLNQLKRYTKRFVIALDADVAGQKATMRSLQVARQTLDREMEVQFDARGLMQQEGRLDADIRVVRLPDGEDPDSIIRQEPVRWTQLVGEAKPIVQYVIDMLVQNLDMGDAKAKTAVARQVMPLINDIPNAVERDHYVHQFARQLGIEERALRQVRIGGGTVDKRPFDAPPKAQKANKPTPILSREAYYLRQCLAYPQIMLQVNQILVQSKQAMVTERDFSQSEDRALLRILYRALNNGTVASIEDLWDSLDTVLQERVNTLLRTLPVPESERGRLPEKIVQSILDWRIAKINQQVTLLHQLIEEQKERTNDLMVKQHHEQLQQLSLAIYHINRAKHGLSAMGR